MHDRPTTAILEPPAAEGLRAELIAGLPVTDRTVRAGGLSTAVLVGGAGPPIVLLHGPGEQAAKWRWVIPDLARDHRVVAPDLPGHGGTSAAAGVPGAGDFIRWLDELIEQTCAEPPTLVGQIVGGAVAARFAADHGDRLERLVLVDSLGLAGFSPAPEFGRALADFVTGPDELTYDELWAQCAYDLPTLRERLGGYWSSFKAAALAGARDETAQATRGALMEQFGFPAIEPSILARISVPTALIWGRHDLATDLEVARDASVRYGWPLHVVDDAADDPPFERPEAFLTALRAAIGSG